VFLQTQIVNKTAFIVS